MSKQLIIKGRAIGPYQLSFDIVEIRINLEGSLATAIATVDITAGEHSEANIWIKPPRGGGYMASDYYALFSNQIAAEIRGVYQLDKADVLT